MHSATLLGYGLLLALGTTPLVIFMSQQRWIVVDSRGVQLVDPLVVLRCLIKPVTVLLCVGQIPSVAHMKDLTSDGTHDGGSKYSLVNVGLSVIIIPVALAIIDATLPGHFYYLDYISATVPVLLYTVFHVIGRALWKAHDDKRVNAAAHPPVAITLTETSREDATETTTTLGKILSFMPVLCVVSFGIGYPCAIIPIFLSGTPSIRLAICIGLHPVLLEGCEVALRATRSANVARELRAGKITMEEAERCIMQSSVDSFIIKQLMSFTRRLMLLNMGSTEATIAGIVGTSMEEAFSRGF